MGEDKMKNELAEWKDKGQIHLLNGAVFELSVKLRPPYYLIFRRFSVSARLNSRPSSRSTNSFTIAFINARSSTSFS